MFDNTLEWAKQLYQFTQTEVDILSHSRKSFLFCEDQPWVKKEAPDFDVTMGAYDGAEICELVGLYILNLMTNLIDKKYIGLYRDDGLAMVKGSWPELERLKKQTHKLFQTFGLKITTESNISSTEFLDVKLNLNNSTFRPYRKNNELPLYINSNSNHPKMIIKNFHI